MRIRAAFLVLAATAAGCAIPSRDNRNDPSNAPDVVLVASPQIGSRTTRFSFDASASTPPRDGGPLRFRWDLHDPDWDDESLLFDYEIDTGTNAVLTSTLTLSMEMICGDDPCPGVGGGARTVYVEVSSEGSGVARGSVTVFVENEAPIASAGEDLFVPESVTGSITLDACGGSSTCTSTDPDGDVLSWEWRKLSGPDIDLEWDPQVSRGRYATFELPPSSAARPLVFEVTATDELASSTAEITVFRETPIWVSTTTPTRLYRFFPGARSSTTYQSGPSVEFLPGIAIGSGASMIDVDPEGHFWLASFGFVGRFTPDFTLASSYSVPSGFGFPRSFAFSSTHALVTLPDNPAGEEGNAYQLLGFDGSETPHVVTPRLRRAHDKGNGDWWLVGADWIGTLDSAGNVAQLQTGLVSVVASASLDDGTLFAADRQVDGSTVLIRRTAVGVVSTWTTPATVDALAERADGTVWVHDTDGLLSVLDVAAGELRPTGMTPMRFWGSTTGHRGMVSDPEGSALWLTHVSQGQIVRIAERQDGSVVETARVSAEDVILGGFWQNVSVDPVSGNAFALGTSNLDGGTVVSIMPAHGKRMSLVPLDAAIAEHLAADARGRVWVGDSDSSASTGLRLVTSAGRVLFERPGRIGGLARMPDAGLWIAELRDGSDSVIRLDESGAEIDSIDIGDQSLRGRIAVDPAETVLCAAKRAAVGSTLTPTPPLRLDLATEQLVELPELIQSVNDTVVVAGSDGACWFVDSGLTNGEPRILRFAAGETTPLVLSSASGISPSGVQGFALDPRDDGVWFSDFSFRLVRASPEGELTFVSLDAATSETALGIEVIPLCDDPDDGGCVEIVYGSVRVGEQPRVVRMTGDGVVLETYTLPSGSPYSVTSRP